MRKLLGLFVVLFMIGCVDVPPEKELHSEKIYLRQLVNKDITETHTSGSFFLVAGSMSSSTESKPVVRVIGNVNGVYRFMEFDLEKVRIKIDNSVKIPYIVLNYFDNKTINTDRLLKHSWYVDSVTIVCPEQYLPEKLLPIQI